MKKLVEVNLEIKEMMIILRSSYLARVLVSTLDDYPIRPFSNCSEILVVLHFTHSLIYSLRVVLVYGIHESRQHV